MTHIYVSLRLYRLWPPPFLALVVVLMGTIIVWPLLRLICPTHLMALSQVVLVGATLTDDQVALAASSGWINDHVAIRVGREDSVPSGLRHR